MPEPGLPPAPRPEADELREVTPSRLLWLVGVFLLGLLAVVALKTFFSRAYDDLGRRSTQEQARLFIGEQIIHNLQQVERDVYLMTNLHGQASLARQERIVGERLDRLEHDLKVLRDGGRVRQNINLNVTAQEEMVREVQFVPPPGAQPYVMELIEIQPLLGQIRRRTAELRGLLERRTVLLDRLDRAAFMAADQEVALYVKQLPPLFHRIEENANRLFFESSRQLAELEGRLATERNRFKALEHLLVLLVVVGVTLAGVLFAREIRDSNRRLTLAWRQMRAAKEEAERASRAKSDFVSRMSHELRTPMNAILGFAQLLDGEGLLPEQKSTVGEINRAGLHLLELINQVLDLAKIEAGRMNLEVIEFDLVRSLDEVAALLFQRAEAKGLALRFFASPDLPASTLGDPTRLRQVLINLVGNAIKFTDQGTVTVRVVPDGPTTAVFTIEDTGIGMDADTLARLFTPFSQADESITRRYGGTGLGLMISRDLVQAMGGDIQVESRVGHGSRFTFRVQLTPVAQAPARPRPLAGARARVLGGEPFQVEALEVLLRALGAELEGGADAQARPCLLFGTAAALRAAAPDPGCVAVVLGGGGDPGLPELAEPVTYTRLEALVRSILPVPGDHSPVEAQEPGRIGPGGPVRILLVEDNAVNQAVAGRMLARLGCPFDLAGNGQLALERLQSGTYGLVLMDMQMPVMGGLAATRAFRDLEQAEGRARTPIVAMTANAFNEDRELCLASGMDDHLPKPIELDRLAQVINRWGAGGENPTLR